MSIVLEAHICNQRRSYKVIFATDDQAASFISKRTATHVVREWDGENTNTDWNDFPLTYDALYPTCEHGMSASLCAGPNHYPSDDQMGSFGSMSMADESRWQHSQFGTCSFDCNRCYQD